MVKSLDSNSYTAKKQVIIQFAIIIMSCLHSANSAKILFFVGVSSHSHRVALQPLATALADKGHDVTFFSPIQPEVQNPKIKEFCPKSLLEYNIQLNKDLSGDPVLERLKDKHSIPMLANYGEFLWEMSRLGNEATIRSPDFQDWLKTANFDLVITEHPMKEVALGIAHKLGAKAIGFAPFPLMTTEPDMFGIPAETSSLPTCVLGSNTNYYSDRFHREYATLKWFSNYKNNYLPKIDPLLKEAFGKETPSAENLVKNINLILINSHFSNEYAKSLPPFVVQVGGMHVQDAKSRKPLPKNIEDFVNVTGSDGFIYISFGSMIQVSALPSGTRKSFFDAIASFKNARFLIKWNGEVPEDMPKNVLPMKWFPQQDVLTHPKCKGFVSQGGLMSFQQATQHGVPVVIIPVLGDQPYNAESAAHQGSGIHLELADITFETFSDALGQLLYSESLSARAKEVGRRFKDRPMSPVDTAVWWSEYVLRHKDTKHLKPLGINQEWWQRRQLDFWAVVFTLLLVCGFAGMWGIRALIRVLTKPQDKLKKQ